jgi:type IV secretory pathway protease TraF
VPGLAPISRRVAGVPGEWIDVPQGGVAPNGVAVPASESSAVDSRARLPDATEDGAVVLAEGRFFVMEMNPSRARDSRYFGAISAHQIVAGARPLWTL